MDFWIHYGFLDSRLANGCARLAPGIIFKFLQASLWRILKSKKKRKQKCPDPNLKLNLVHSRGPTKKKIWARPPRRSWYQGSWCQDLGTKILVPGSWYQDLGTKPERRSLSVCRDARGAAGPPPSGLGGWKPPSKNNLMDPEPGPNSWTYFSPIFVGQIPENIFHPYSWAQLWCIYPNSIVNLSWILGECIVDMSQMPTALLVWRIKYENH